jgi:hypothetical protein
VRWQVLLAYQLSQISYRFNAIDIPLGFIFLVDLPFRVIPNDPFVDEAADIELLGPEVSSHGEVVEGR